MSRVYVQWVFKSVQREPCWTMDVLQKTVNIK